MAIPKDAWVVVVDGRIEDWWERPSNAWTHARARGGTVAVLPVAPRGMQAPTFEVGDRVRVEGGTVVHV